MHFAAQTSDDVVISLLAESGAAISPRDTNGQTPLHYAVSAQNTTTVKILLDFAADPNALDNQGFGPLHLATELGTHELVVLLLTYHAIPDLIAPSPGKGWSRWSAIHIAAKQGYDYILKRLLDVEPSANASSRKDQRATPLHVAARAGQSEAIGILLEHDEEIKNALDTNNETALFPAVRGRHIECVRKLVNAETPPGKNIQGRTPLHVASSHGFFEIIEVLLDSDSDDQLNATDFEGNTPLHLALIAGRKEAVRILLDRGADIMIRNQKRQSSYALAKGDFRSVINKHIAEHPEKWQSSPVLPIRRVKGPTTPKAVKREGQAARSASTASDEMDELNKLETEIRQVIADVRDGFQMKFATVMQLLQDLEEDAT
jgi:ankyrin repeat protein